MEDGGILVQPWVDLGTTISRSLDVAWTYGLPLPMMCSGPGGNPRLALEAAYLDVARTYGLPLPMVLKSHGSCHRQPRESERRERLKLIVLSENCPSEASQVQRRRDGDGVYAYVRE